MPVLDLRAASRAVPLTIADPGPLRAAALRTWHGRMVNEHGSAPVFEALATQLEAVGAPAEDVARCREFADQERSHGVLCGAVVEALGGEARADIAEPEPVPEHPDVTPLEGVLRNLIHVGCMSETVAVSLIGAERIDMPDGELLELLTRIYADECAHSAFGWRMVRKLLPEDAELRASFLPWLRVAFAHLEEHELAHLPAKAVFPAEGAKWGLCSGPDARALFFATIEQIIVPGLEEIGLPASEAWNTRREVVAA